MEPIPAETVAAVRRATDRLAEGIVQEIRAENRVYADVLEGPEGVGIRLGIEQAIGAFLDAIERGDHPGGETAEVWRRLGEAAFQAGRALDALCAAWRTGTRAAWRGAADLAAEAGMPTQTVIALAEGIFVFTEELASDVVEGYVRRQSDEAGERERRRRRLMTLVLDPEGGDPEALAHAAELAHWPMPRVIAALALDSDSAGPLVRRLDLDALVGSEAGGAVLVLPDPDGPGRAAALRRALVVLPAAAVLGPTVPAREAHRSLRWARIALELVRRDALPSARPTRVADHLATMVLLQDAGMARALVTQHLSALTRCRMPSASGCSRHSARGSPINATRRGSPPSSTSIPRPCATGWASCGSCSAARSTPRTGASRSSSLSALGTR